MGSTLVKYTGHPMVDVGAATLAALAGKGRPEDLTVEDLEAAAAYLQEQYQRKYLASYLVCVFPNSAYVNPTAGTEKKEAFLSSHLFAFREAPARGALPCGLCGTPAVTRGFRQHVPMLTGEGALNFFPNAEPGLALCAGCMLSIAAMPLGALRCAGRALLVHADDPALTFRLAQEHLQHNQRLLHLQGLADDAKYPDAKQARTRLMDSLQRWAEEAAMQNERAVQGRRRPVSLTAYHLTNSGQGPDLAIYHLPAPVLLFLMDAETTPHRRAWHGIIAAGWRLNDRGGETETRNFLYEDMFRLPDAWKRFVRTYFLRRAYRWAGRDDPRGAYQYGRELDLIQWPLTALFLREVAGMEKQRVDAIRQFGDRLAEYIAERDEGFWNDFNLAKSYRSLRARLIRANRNEQKADRPPLIGFDDFVTIFEYSSEGEFGVVEARPDWNLSRDLVLIRVIEELHRRKFFVRHKDALDVVTATEAADSDDTVELTGA